MRIGVALVAVAVLLGIWAWVSDFVTLQGEATVYTVRCDGGEWRDGSCSGTLLPADRYRFRALRLHREVLFWVVGSSEPSGKFTDCEIVDGRNWSCKPGAESARSITHRIHQGRATHGDAPLRPFQAVSKWRWLLLREGLPAGRSADY